jgi:hypothetical protein
MARDESDREDLLREATALVERVEFTSACNPGCGNIVAGFRAGGGLSIYFGQDPSYQFNLAGELRRAFVDGLLVKAECGKLVALERVRQAQEVNLVRHPLSDTQQAEFLFQMRQQLRSLTANCDVSKLTIIGQMPPGADVLGRVLAEIKRLDAAPVAHSPRAG